MAFRGSYKENTATGMEFDLLARIEKSSGINRKMCGEKQGQVGQRLLKINECMNESLNDLMYEKMIYNERAPDFEFSCVMDSPTERHEIL